MSFFGKLFAYGVMGVAAYVIYSAVREQWQRFINSQTFGNFCSWAQAVLQSMLEKYGLSLSQPQTITVVDERNMTAQTHFSPDGVNAHCSEVYSVLENNAHFLASAGEVVPMEGMKTAYIHT